MGTDEDAIRQCVADWMSATRSGDLGRVLGLMSEDALFLTPGHPPMTKADFAKASETQATGGMRIDPTSEVQEVQVSGDLAFVRAHLTVRVTPAGGPPMERTGQTLSIFKKQNGQWLLARDANLLAVSKK